MEQNIILYWMEVNIGFCRTTDMVNQYRQDMGRDEIGRNVIMNAFKRLNPYITKIDENNGNTK